MFSLIVTADDFGKDQQTNRAVIIGKKEGILTSASLMVVGKKWEEAVEIAKEEGIDVGLHISLTEGESIYLKRYVKFSPSSLGIRAQFFKDKALFVRKEIELQCKRFVSTGIPLNHIDSHHHIHVHPLIRREVIKSCIKYHIKGIRIPHEPWEISAPISKKKHRLRNFFYKIVFSHLNKRLFKEAKTNKLVFTDGVFGLYNTGEITESWIILFLERMRKIGARGTFELYLHPEDKKTSPGFSELKALTSEKVRKKITELGIRLISFSQFVATHV